MKVVVDNLYATVTEASAEEADWLTGYLTFKTEGFVRAGGRSKHITSEVCLYNGRTRRFPAGVLALVRKAVPDEGYALDVTDQRLPPCAALDLDVALDWHRDYQREATERAIGAGRGLLWLPTGACKTEIAAGLAAALPCRWLFVVHRSGLARQAAERLERRTGERAGMIGDGEWRVERFTCATFATLYAALEGRNPKHSPSDVMAVLGGIQGVIVEEAHTLPAQSYYRVIMAMSQAYWRIGLSGTPLARGDRRSIYTIASLGPVIYHLKPGKLIDDGILARPRIRMVRCLQSPAAKTWAGVYSEAVVKSAARNRVVAEMARAAEKPAIVFVKEVKHGAALKATLERSGVSCVYVDGKAATEKRQAAVKRLERAEVDVLVSTVVFQEGVDIPCLRSVVVAAGGASVIAALQRIGRGMRVAEGKDTFEVWDVFDQAPDGKEWLEKQARRRAGAYLAEGHAVEVADAVLGPYKPLVVRKGGHS